MKTVIKVVSTFFYAGYVPRIPGTIGALVGLLFYLTVSYSLTVILASLFVLTVMAVLVIRKAEELYGEKDSRRIVIDEVIGMMIALLFVPLTTVFLISGFILFRIFDIVKPFPIKRIEKMESPWGVLLDDVVAGLYANLTVQLIAMFALKRGT